MFSCFPRWPPVLLFHNSSYDQKHFLLCALEDLAEEEKNGFNPESVFLLQITEGENQLVAPAAIKNRNGYNQDEVQHAGGKYLKGVDLW